MRNITLTMCLSICTLISVLSARDDRYRNRNLPIDQRVEILLKQMSLEEKLGQMQCCGAAEVDKALKEGKDLLFGNVIPHYLRRYKDPAEMAAKCNEVQKLVTGKQRLGIPLLFHDEALHGLLVNNSASYPQAIALAATWNPQLVSRVAAAIAEETRARGIRQVLSPVVNIVRDVRWGRVEETYGEDPYLTSRLGVAFCREFERRGVITTPKHYIANVGDGGRDSNIVHFSERLLREIYFPAFHACIREGGARSIMAAYNAVDGIPCSANDWLLTEILRKEWGFRGIVVSDYGSVKGIMSKHHTAANPVEAAAQAVEAGLDIEFPKSEIFRNGLRKAVTSGRLPVRLIDQAVRRILRVKFEIGLFDEPFADPQKAKALADCPAHRALAREACRQSIVLLKNRNRILPLDRKKIRKVALLGPRAREIYLGGYSGRGTRKVTIEEGIRAKLGKDAEIRILEGADLS
ncbi:MAG: glycoside hydrolase family 3 protein, partial [Lentisphaerae bacterium]